MARGLADDGLRHLGVPSITNFCCCCIVNSQTYTASWHACVVTCSALSLTIGLCSELGKVKVQDNHALWGTKAKCKQWQPDDPFYNDAAFQA